ncbi:MAG: DUF1127 domain-containing protein [Proteobacteria bacterium]|nr:DUF1127 domain-containing protein [Pseudomonadota bacterium]
MPALTRPLGAPARHVEAFGSLLHRVAVAAATWQRRSRERSRLAALTDRELRDIGITRADAAAVAHKPFWRA